MNITDAELKMLKTTFFHRVVKGRSIYEKTTAEEWKEFERFVTEFGPFDLVIDGLNVAHKTANSYDAYQRSRPSATKVWKEAKKNSGKKWTEK